MESFFGRHKNATVLAIMLALQVLGLATQIKRPTESGPVRLIRFWAVNLITPIERGYVHSEGWIRGGWRDYFYLRGVRKENSELRQQIEQMRLEQVRLEQDAAQARRLQALLQFKEQYISKTVAAQVVGSSGSETSRLIYIDRGARDGIEANMAVITPTGIVGKILRAYPTTSQVLEITDQSSGVGATLVKSRLQGILKGQPSGDPRLAYIMSDEAIEPGEEVITSGGDRIFPKGLPVGKVASVSPGKDLFLNVRVTPTANLGRLEEVLVITKIDEREPNIAGLGPIRAADILAQRLPSVPNPPPAPGMAPANEPAKPAGAAPATSGAATAAQPAKPVASATNVPAGTVRPAAAAPATPSAANTQPAAKPAPSAAAKPGPTTPAAPRPTHSDVGVSTAGVKPAGANTVAKPSAAGATAKPVTPKPASPAATGATTSASRGTTPSKPTPAAAGGNVTTKPNPSANGNPVPRPRPAVDNPPPGSPPSTPKTTTPGPSKSVSNPTTNVGGEPRATAKDTP